MQGLLLSPSPSSFPLLPSPCSNSSSSTPACLCCRPPPSLAACARRSRSRNGRIVRHCSRPIRALSDPTTEQPSSSEGDTALSDEPQREKEDIASSSSSSSSSSSLISKDISQAVKKTAATFAPRASTKSKNPAVPGSTLYTVFEVQGYVSMFAGGLLSFNLVFPSSEPDIWRLMGMWSIWMFTIPSLRARDCSNKEKDALNYLFLGIPLINVVLPLFWKSFAAVWSADVLAFFAVYAWKLDWISDGKVDN